MTLSIKNDSSRPGGGYALLEGSGLADVTAITIENCASGQYLGEDGKWGRRPFAFPVEAVASGALLLGPHIVDHVDSDLQIALRSEGGVELGKVFWVDIIVSRNPGSVTSAQVFEDRRRKAEAAETARLDAEQAAQSATDAESNRLQAETKAKAEADAREAAKRVVPEPGPKPEPKPKRTGLIATLLLLALAVAAGIVLAINPGLLGTKKTEPPAPVQQPIPPAPAPAPQPPEPPHETPSPPPTPTPPPPPPAPAPAAVDCNSYDDRLAGLSGLSDEEKVKLGQQALKDGCGAEAFRAFDSSDPQTSEAAAWNLARFYDPNETDPVYRHAAPADAASAAVYYHLWRGRSRRQAEALAKLCEANTGGGASLQRSCAR